MQAQAVFLKMMPYFFKISAGEELSQPIKRANEIIISIFFIMKATILDTHDITIVAKLQDLTHTSKKAIGKNSKLSTILQ